MNRRPIVTYAGDNSLFTGLQAGLVTSLPQESVEWRRSYGRPSRCVHVEVDFVPFAEECLVKDATRTILGQPIFHTYWTDCADVEVYKSTMRDNLQTWVASLRQQGVTDWMVILLETPDTRKGNKLLPRTTVLDKIKNDFGGKQAERCVSLIDPLKTDSRSMESWQTLLTKMRHLLMISYNRALNRFEENMRAERERRIEKSWSFCSYFLLQEELAQVFSLLALHDEALVQYDELDALFTQFVLNSAHGDSPPWLATFSQPCEKWEGLHLTSELDLGIQGKIRSKEVTLIEFRNYLFQRQCALLFRLNKHWEVASRSLTFLQNTVGELNILEVNVAPGGVACWGVLSGLEIIDALQNYKEPSTTDAHALHTAPLWAYARDKLQELGILCGLMPGSEAKSTQLHTVISLVYGMGNDPHTHDEPSDDPSVQDTPMTRLKDALSSPEAFKKHFLDLSEVAISTYKHIGRIRSARLIGKDLATFYMAQGEPQKAATFLTDQLTMFLDEKWLLLAACTQLTLATCYQSTSDSERYIRTCAQLSGSEVLSTEIRKEHFENMSSAIEKVGKDSPLMIPSERIFEITGIKLISEDRIILDSEVQVELVVFSMLPEDLMFKSVSVMLQHFEEDVESSSKRSVEVERKTSTSSSASQPSTRKTLPSTVVQRSGSNSGDQDHQSGPSDSLDTDTSKFNLMTQPLHMSLHLEYKQDKSLSSAAVTCSDSQKVLRRRDSQGGLFKSDRNVTKEEVKDKLCAENVIIKPGKNTVKLSTKVSKKGKFTAIQVALSLVKVEFICGKASIGGFPLCLEVVSENPRIFLGRRDRDLLAGIHQPMVLTVHSGSWHVTDGTTVKLRTSRGLTVRQDREDAEAEVKPLEREIEISLPEVDPFSSVAIPLTVLADLGPQRDASTVEHSVNISSSLIEQRADIDVHFIPPFMTSHKLQTANMSKFVQVTMTGLVSRAVEISEPSLSLCDPKQHVLLKSLHPPTQSLVVCTDQSASYMWEVGVDYEQDATPTLKLEFSVKYRPLNENNQPLEEEVRTYTSSFDLQDYKTLYTIRAKVEPSKGSELCRAGNMCHLHIALQQVASSPADANGQESQPSSHSIMYEVLADQTMWAVCGRTAGVLTLEGGVRQSVILDVMPLTGGFLPLPSVRLSKYIPADSRQPTPRDGGRKNEYGGSASSVPRLEPFSPGQVYNFSKAQQVHVLPASNMTQSDLSVT